MSARHYIFVIPGIHTDPRKVNSWPDQFARLLDLRTPEQVKTEAWEYFTTAGTRWIKQASRAKELVASVEQVKAEGCRVSAVVHSNGADLATRAMLDGIEFDSLHFIAPAAVDAQVEQCVKHKRVQKLHIYGSRNDKALKFAWLSREFLFKIIGKGFGSLGLRGREFAERFPGVVFDHSNDEFDHGTWLDPKHLSNTVNQVLANEGYTSS